MDCTLKGRPHVASLLAMTGGRGDGDGGGLTANPDGTYTDGEHTYTPTGSTVSWSDGNEYPVYHDENGDPYGYVNGEMIYYV